MSLMSLLRKRETGLDIVHSIPNFHQRKRSESLKLGPTQPQLDSTNGPISSLSLDPNEGRYLLSGGRYVYIFDLYESAEKLFKEKIQLKKVHSKSISSLCWYSKDTGMFITGSFDHKIKVWDTNLLQEVISFDLDYPVNNIAMSSSFATNDLVAVASNDQNIRLIDLRTASSTHTLIGHRESNYSVKWSPIDENLLVSGSADGSIRLWDIRRSGALKCFDQFNVQLDYQPPNSKVAVDCPKAHDRQVVGLCFSPNGQFLISAGRDNKVRLWNVSTAKNTLVNFGLNMPFALTRTIELSISQDGSIVYIPNSTNRIQVNEVQTGKRITLLSGHAESVNCCVFNLFNQDLYSGGNDGQILRWTSDRLNGRIIEEENPLQQSTEGFFNF